MDLNERLTNDKIDCIKAIGAFIIAILVAIFTYNNVDTMPTAGLIVFSIISIVFFLISYLFVME